MAAAVRTFVQPTEIPAGYDVTQKGIYFTESDPHKQLTTVPAWVTGVFRTLVGNSWSVEIAWRDHDGNIKTAIIAYADLLLRSNILEELAQDGLLFLPGCTNQVARYLALAVALPTTPRVRTHRKLGFFTLERDGEPDTLGFMLPYTCLLPACDEPADAAETNGTPPNADGDNEAEQQEEAIRFHPLLQSKTFEAYTPAGKLEDWQAVVAPMAGNALIVFAVCAGFASPFLALAGLDNVIFHLFGNSSTGKTTALQAGVSPWGRGSDPQMSGLARSLIERWNSTSNAMEPMAATHSDLLLAIDELGSSGDSTVSVYNATSGRGKARMTDTGGMRDQHQWTLCILSSGEFSMQEKIEETTKRKAKTGEIIRANDIPVAELAHDSNLSQDEERQLIEALKRQCAESYGTAGPAFVQAVLDHFRTAGLLRERLKGDIDTLHSQLIEFFEASGCRLGPAHVRAMRRFAFVGAVGCLASQTEVLPFSAEVVVQSIVAISGAWLSGLPPLSEGKRALDDIRAYVVRNTGQILNFDVWQAAGSPQSGLPRDLRAIRKRDLFLFTPEQFAQACGDMSVREALKYLHGEGILRREGAKMTYRVDMAELGLKRFPFYAVYAKRLLSGDELEHDATSPQEEDTEFDDETDNIGSTYDDDDDGAPYYDEEDDNDPQVIARKARAKEMWAAGPPKVMLGKRSRAIAPNSNDDLSKL